MGTREGEGTGPSCSGGSIARARISCACRRLVPVWAHACPTCVYSTTFWSTPALYTARASLLTQRVSTSAPAVWLWKVAPGIGIRVRASKKVTRPVESPVTSVPSRSTATLHTIVCSCRFFSTVRRDFSWPVGTSQTAAVELPRPPNRYVSRQASSLSSSESFDVAIWRRGGPHARLRIRLATRVMRGATCMPVPTCSNASPATSMRRTTPSSHPIARNLPVGLAAMLQIAPP